MENIEQYHYNSIDEYHQFKSFEEIKYILNHFESLYFKDKKFLFLKIKKPLKNEAILKLRRTLSRSIFTFIFNNYNSISKDDLIFISQFFSKYFFIEIKKIKTPLSPLNPFYLLSIIDNYIFSIFFEKPLKNNKLYFSYGNLSYFKEYYWLLFLIIFLDNKFLIDNFLLNFPIHHEFYYYYIVAYFERYYQRDHIIKNHYFFEHILLNLEKNNIEELKTHMRNNHHNILIDLIKGTEEKQRLKLMIADF